MPIVCPHCATSYAVDADKLGSGRTVRCARCKEVWVARPEPQLAMAAEIEWDDLPIAAPAPVTDEDTPMIESPPLAVELPDFGPTTQLVPVSALHPEVPVIDVAPEPPPRDRRRTDRRKSRERRSTTLGLSTAVVAMGALIGALLVWRADVVRLMPQTALFYKTIGLNVNLRGLSFEGVKLGGEVVDGQPVLVIEGAIVDELKRPLEIPKLRFVVRDAKGTAIYAWNASADETAIEPGQRVAFRSRLAQPPQEAHAIDVRFVTKRDLAAGAI